MASKLASTMRRKGVSAYRLARETGLAESTVSRLMRGKCDGNLDSWRRIAACLGVTLDEITPPAHDGIGSGE